jgi:hypothetical protein
MKPGADPVKTGQLGLEDGVFANNIALYVPIQTIQYMLDSKNSSIYNESSHSLRPPVPYEASAPFSGVSNPMI